MMAQVDEDERARRWLDVIRLISLATEELRSYDVVDEYKVQVKIVGRYLGGQRDKDAKWSL